MEYSPRPEGEEDPRRMTATPQAASRTDLRRCLVREGGREIEGLEEDDVAAQEEEERGGGAGGGERRARCKDSK